MGNQRAGDRRQSTDRRQAPDRRRQSDARYPVFEICRSSLHLALVVQGANGEADRVVTRSVGWRQEATSLHSDRGVQEITEAFRTLVNEERLAGAQVRIALGGEFCVTRVITGPTEEVRREFAELEERSLRYLTLGPGRKALAGSVQPLDARHQYALLTVANQKTLDLLLRIAEATGIHIISVEPSLIALSRAQAHLQNTCQEACLLIQLDEVAAEVGICHQGRLLLDYRPGGHTQPENVAELVALHLSRLQRFLQRHHAYLNSPLRHVYLTGEPAEIERARRKFAQLKQFDVEVLEPKNLATPWQYVDDTPGTELSAALGVAMLLYPPAAELQAPNLIERTLAELRPPLRPVLVRSLIPLAAMLLVAAGIFAAHVRERMAVGSLRREFEALAPVLARATELKLQMAAAEGKLGQLEILASKLPQTNWPQILSRISQSMPEDVWLDRVTVRDGNSASLTGASYSDGGVYDFVSYLKQVPEISEIALQGTGMGQSSTGPTTSFDLELTLAKFVGRNGNEARHD